MITVHSEQLPGHIKFKAMQNGEEVGSMEVSITPYVHGMEIQPGMLQRKVAEALFLYASGCVKAMGFTEALLSVAPENEPMHRFVSERTVKEEPGSVYWMQVA